ncbi:MAG TPA: hypothetical protein V6D11_22995, partial [Waterburya sp.]
QNVCIASIGPQTTAACRQLLGRVDIEAQEYTLEGLTHAIVQWATDTNYQCQSDWNSPRADKF